MQNRIWEVVDNIKWDSKTRKIYMNRKIKFQKLEKMAYINTFENVMR